MTAAGDREKKMDSVAAGAALRTAGHAPSPAFKFFEYSQNNSGGSFDVDDARGIGPRVWVEAYDKVHADARAETIGLYWDGVQKQMDCPCCGDRWYPTYGDGSPAPSPYKHYDFMWHDTVYVHRIDGTIDRLSKAEG